jgi:hypothetical protein
MTLNEFYRRVLEHLTVVAEGQSADAADTQLVASRYRNVYELLATERLIVWGIGSDIPDFAALPLIYITAANVAKEFGQPPDRQEAELGERLLRRAMAAQYIPYRSRAEYF